MLLLAGGFLASCTQRYATLPPDAAPTPRRLSTVPSAARIQGNVPTTAVQLPAQAVSRSFGNNPWQPSEPPRDWKYIVLHHTATSSGSVEEIHEEHLKKGWEGIGYHFVIGNGSGMGDGTIEPTFRWREQMHGAHAGKSEFNQQGIGVVLVGNFEESSPSTAQVEAATRLVATLKREYGISSENVIPHSEVKATLCPGKNFPLEAVATAQIFDTLSQQPQQQPPPEFAGRMRRIRR